MTHFVKKSLRQTLKAIRNHLSPQFQAQSSDAVCRRIQKIDAYRHSKRIALYHAFSGEIGLHDIWRSAPLQGKFCYFPVLTEEKTLLFLPATPKTPFESNQYGIPEPCVTRNAALPADAFDIIFMPLLGFDVNGTRLGMGKGYYDRTLAAARHPRLIGIAYDFQKLSYIKSESWDIRMDAVVTPSTVYWSPSLWPIG